MELRRHVAAHCEPPRPGIHRLYQSLSNAAPSGRKANKKLPDWLVTDGTLLFRRLTQSLAKYNKQSGMLFMTLSVQSIQIAHVRAAAYQHMPHNHLYRSKHPDSVTLLRDEGIQDADPCAVVDRRSTPRLKETIHKEEWRSINSPRAPILHQNNKASFRTHSGATQTRRLRNINLEVIFHLAQRGKVTLKETLAAESVLESLKPDRNSDTELPTAFEAIFDISSATAGPESDDVAEL